MRSPRVLFPFLLLAIPILACNDVTTPRMRGSDQAPANVSTLNLEQYIDQQIALLYDQGFEASVQARWNTVKRKKATNFAVAAKDLSALADWIDKKAGSITPPVGESQLEASVRLVLNMSHWLYGGGNTPIEPEVGQDVAVEVVPAGQPATVKVPSEHAAVDFGPQNQDRIIIISQQEYPGQCNGPLKTSRCQYPLFYRFDSFPHEKLAGSGRFAICLVTTGDRRPLEYPSDEPGGEVHRRIRLAHELPADPANYTPGATREGQIEILQLASEQKGITRCNQESHVGMGSFEKALHNVMHFAGRVLSPRDAFAYDQGPEHQSDFFSYFNAVDASSQPDVAVTTVSAPASGFAGDPVSVSYTVENRSRRSGGHATASSRSATAQLYLSGGEGELTAPLGGPDEVLPMRPDDPAQTFTKTVTLPSNIALDVDYHVVAIVSNAGEHGEVSLENNTRFAAAPTRVKRKRADLQFSNGFTVTPMEVTQGNSVTASSWTVANTGNAASGVFDGQFYLVSASGARTALGSPVPHGSLDAGSSAAHAAQTLAIAGSVAPGTYSVELVLDDPNVVQEFDETNNRFSIAGLVVKAPAPVLGSKVLVFGDYHERNTATNILRGFGYTVDLIVTLPTDLSPYKAIWHVGAFAALTSSEIDRLKAFLGTGGGLHLTGERPCCETLNASLQSLINGVVTGGGVSVGGKGDFASGFNFNPTAHGSITMTPNTLTVWYPLSPGGMGGVSGANVLVTHQSGMVTGAVWGEPHLQGGKGRLTILMDVNWFSASSTATAIMRNIQNYLDRGTGPGAAPIVASMVDDFAATTSPGQTYDETMGPAPSQSQPQMSGTPPATRPAAGKARQLRKP